MCKQTLRNRRCLARSFTSLAGASVDAERERVCGTYIHHPGLLSEKGSQYPVLFHHLNEFEVVLGLGEEVKYVIHSLIRLNSI